MRFVVIITNNVKEHLRVRRIFVVEVANSVLTINCITMNLCGPSIIYISISLLAFKEYIFVMRYRII
jgi:hypothetical protein